MDLQKYQVERLDITGPDDISWADAGRTFLPTLNRQSLEWFMGNLPTDGNPEKMQQLSRDLLPNRIGALQTDTQQCIPVNWASIMQMIKQDSRERVPETERFMVLAVICLISTIDEKLIFIHRSEKVKQYPGFYHVTAAGYVDTDTVFEHGLWGGIVGTAYKELKEEANLDPEHLQVFRCVGGFKILDPNSSNIDIGFAAQTQLTSNEILALAVHAKDTYEGKHSAVPISKFQEFLTENSLVPSAAGCILTYLER